MFNIKKFSRKIFFASFVFFNLNSNMYSQTMPLEYYTIDDVQEQKKYFFNFFYKLIDHENRKILKEKEFVKSYLNSNILEIDYDSEQFKKLIEIKNRYKIKKLYTPSAYEKKIDIVPPSLALAQAAVESGWGRSRFFKKANNIFGHWTYNPEIGILPEDREIGATHFVRVFSDLTSSISAYMLNLNRNFAYREFREKRFLQRLRNKTLDGLSLSQTMINYSGIASEYLELLKELIITNDLEKYDTYFETNLN